jgi:hypothetical protein
MEGKILNFKIQPKDHISKDRDVRINSILFLFTQAIIFASIYLNKINVEFALPLG